MAKSRNSRQHSKRGSKITLVLLTTLFMFTVLLLAVAIVFVPVSNHESTPNELASYRRKTSESGYGLGERGVQIEVLSSREPRAFLIHNFLTKEECVYLIALATPHMEKSTVVDSATGLSKESRARTSSGMFLDRGQDEIIRHIEQRIAELTCIPVEHGEEIHVLHYEVGQKYDPHTDYFFDKFNVKNGGNRMATLLMYLSDVEEGGETVFPNTRANISSVPWWNELSECGRKGLSVKPKMGNALLFWSMKPDATVDPSSLHGSCPVIEGNKWSATKWMRVHKYISL